MALLRRVGVSSRENAAPMTTDRDRDLGFARERSHLLAVAFRLLASESDAQDVVQEAWIRYAGADVDRIDNVPAWLTTVVTRLCLDRLRRTRELPHETVELPEPDDGGGNPEEVAVLAGELTEAVTVLLDRLTPPQRVALVLHDVFGAPFDEVADVLGTTSGSAKKLASRARARVRGSAGVSEVDPGAARDVVRAFLSASQQGDVDGLLGLLHPDATRTADPQALPAGGGQRANGARSIVEETLTLRRIARHARMATINGWPGITVLSGQRVVAAMTFQIARGVIVHFDVISDPARLAVLRIAPDTV